MYLVKKIIIRHWPSKTDGNIGNHFCKSCRNLVRLRLVIRSLRRRNLYSQHRIFYWSYFIAYWVCNYQLMRIFIFCSDGFPYVFAPVFSTPAISTRAIYSCLFHSCIFHSRIFGRFTKAQMRKFLSTTKAQKYYYETATVVIIENRNNSYETANFRN